MELQENISDAGGAVGVSPDKAKKRPAVTSKLCATWYIRDKRNIEIYMIRGESEKLAGDHDIVLTRWRDKHDVYIVGTNTDGSVCVKPRSRYCAELMSVPNMILDYNHHMGGVDHLDQFRAYYDVGRDGRKWWKYIMFGLFNFAIVNAYILKCLANKPLPSNRRQWSLKAFKVALVHQLCDGFSSRKRASMSSVHEVQDVIESDAIPGHDIVRFLGRKSVY